MLIYYVDKRKKRKHSMVYAKSRGLRSDCFRHILRIVLTYRKNSKYWDIYVWANSVDSDQTALKEQSDQDLHCLPFFQHLLEALL